MHNMNISRIVLFIGLMLFTNTALQAQSENFLFEDEEFSEADFELGAKPAMVHREYDSKATWWWLHNQTSSSIKTFLKKMI